jgi:hypothetical protein
MNLRLQPNIQKQLLCTLRKTAASCLCLGRGGLEHQAVLWSRPHKHIVRKRRTATLEDCSRVPGFGLQVAQEMPRNKKLRRPSLSLWHIYLAVTCSLPAQSSVTEQRSAQTANALEAVSGHFKKKKVTNVSFKKNYNYNWFIAAFPEFCLMEQYSGKMLIIFYTKNKKGVQEFFKCQQVPLLEKFPVSLLC